MGKKQDSIHICQATEEDVEGILELQNINQAVNGGMLSAALPRDRLLDMMANMPIIIARQNKRVVGFLMSSDRKLNADIPIVREMLAAYPGSENAYLYGPICVDSKIRGRGIAQAMFAELRRLQPGREGFLFVRRDNAPSIRAHEKMEMREVASFEFKGADHAVFSYLG